MTALGDLEVLVRALSLAPRRILGLDRHGWALVAPEGDGRDPAFGRADPLSGIGLSPRVLGFLPD
jgi:hypothetical protein